MKPHNFNSKIYLFKTIPLLLLLLIFPGSKIVSIHPFGESGDDDIYTRINRNMDIFGRVYKEIALNYVDEVDPEKFMKAGIDGMLNTLDPYTNFLDESRKDEIDLLTTGRYGGIGITISIKDSMIVITEIMEGYSAQKEGLRKGDLILEIDGISLAGKKAGDVRAFVRGAAGSQLKMKIKRGDKELDFVLTRQEIKLKNVTYKGIISEGVGYIKLERFNQNTENEVIEALTELNSKGPVKGIVIDLRDNPGGLLDAALSILNKFTDRGSLLLTTRGRRLDSEKKYFSTEDPVLKKDIPLAVIINDNSASASEIFAGAVQDLDRGVVVGTKSFGKGLVQVYSPLSYNNQLKITNQKYFTPSGRWIQTKNYFRENKYSVFKPNPYFSQTEFKTLNGRIVYAEGGITPDSVIVSYENNELLDELLSQDFYYRFAEKYVYEHPEIVNADVSDGIADEFYDFLNAQSFDYKAGAETKLSELKDLLNEKKYSDKVNKLVSELETELKLERLRDFDASKVLIKRQLEIELMKKLNKTEKEIIDAGFNEDIQLQTALSIITNRELYNRFLNIGR
ncbi:MAG: S41 family peptidase [Ignavibacteria bacterium]